MPTSEKSSQATATTSSSRSTPIVEKIGAKCAELTAGLVLCATTQIEHELASV